MFRIHFMKITLRIAVILSPVISTSSSLRIKAAYVQANSADILYPIQSKTINVSGMYFVFVGVIRGQGIIFRYQRFSKSLELRLRPILIRRSLSKPRNKSRKIIRECPESGFTLIFTKTKNHNFRKFLLFKNR